VIHDPWQSLKTKHRIPTAPALYNRLLFKLITIFNNLNSVKSYKMERMTIEEKAGSVGILVCGLSLWQQLLTLSLCLSFFYISWLLRKFATWMIFLSLLKAACHYHRQQTHTGVFDIRRRSRSRATTKESVMSTSRKTNGTHECLMSRQKVCYHLKVEQLFAKLPRRGLVLT
jgi:hypothetical protein